LECFPHLISLFIPPEKLNPSHALKIHFVLGFWVFPPSRAILSTTPLSPTFSPDPLSPTFLGSSDPGANLHESHRKMFDCAFKSDAFIDTRSPKSFHRTGFLSRRKKTAAGGARTRPALFRVPQSHPSEPWSRSARRIEELWYLGYPAGACSASPSRTKRSAWPDRGTPSFHTADFIRYQRELSC